jgi:hypothetical protein
MPAHDTVPSIRTKNAALRPQMTERLRRQWAAAEAIALGRGGITAVSVATGMSRTTITRGIRELHGAGHAEGEEALPPGRSRRPGGGGKPLTQTDATLLSDLDALVEPSTRGDPQSPLRWTCTSTYKLAEQLRARGHRVGARTVEARLKGRGYSLQGNRKTKGGLAPRPRRPVRVHRPARPLLPEAWAAGRLGGREEEGAGRRL